MATSIAPGNWHADAATVWDTGTAPEDGEVAILEHHVTVDQPTIIGTSPAAGTNAVSIAAGGKLNVDAALTVRGDIRVTGGTTSVKRTIIEISAGNGIEMDASQATDPTNQEYQIDCASAQFQYTHIAINGTPGARCYIRSNSGGGNASIRTGYLDAAFINATYCDFTRIGTASTDAIATNLRVPDAELHLEDCTFDYCGAIDPGVVQAAVGDLSFVRLTFTNSLGTKCIDSAAGSQPPSGGQTRQMYGCVFDKLIDTFWATGATIGAENVFLGGAGWNHISSNYASMNKYNFYAGENRNGTTVYGDAVSFSGYIFNERSASMDRHGVLVGAPTSTGTTNLHDIIYESDGEGSAGNGLLFNGGSGDARNYNIRRVIILPNSTGHGSGNLIHHYGNETNVLDVQHCTAHIAGEGGGINALSNNARFTAVKNNIFYDTVDDRSHKITTTGGANDADTIFGGGANADYNCGYQFAEGSQGKGYDIAGWSVAPGANDIEEDPQFVDATRDLASWDAALGGAGTNESGKARLASRTNTVQELFDWVVAGHAPENQNLKGAADNGGDMGAVPVAGTVITTTVTATNAAGSDQEQFTWTEVDPP